MKKLNFRNLISIKEYKTVLDDDGFVETKLVEITKAWADIRTMQGREFYAAATVARIGMSRFIIRYIPGITQDMKIEFKGKLYNLESIENDDEQNKTITMIGTTKDLEGNGNESY